MRDAEFGAVQLRSFGMYAYRISDPAKFFKEVSGVAAEYSGAELETQLRNIAVTQLAAAFGSSGIPFFGHGSKPGFAVAENRRIARRGICQTRLDAGNFTVESITLPAAIQEALDKKISMGVIGDLGRYTQYQTAESIPLAAQNEGGLAGIGAGLGVGAGVGQAMAGAMAGMMQPAAQPAAHPLKAFRRPPKTRRQNWRNSNLCWTAV